MNERTSVWADTGQVCGIDRRGETRSSQVQVDRVASTSLAPTTSHQNLIGISTARRHPVHRFRWITYLPPFILTAFAGCNYCVFRHPVCTCHPPTSAYIKELRRFRSLDEASTWVNNQQAN